ncbi:hypothetical protein [Kitasatospora viridis]|uniref:Uncharacterized protein n=1 Tax=Kitasatospora viridis TaxID=281105 RepID=A0A561UMJ8_9ACTN|nr:hypothetical protein [Kitasatospora viridis]TWG00582.1 hypothetical protein FHX73_114462 [Kitasatospora viridis]
MASPASSEPVEAIPLLGRSWYRRGAGYWLRRVGVAVYYLLITAVVGGLGAAIFSAVSASWGQWRPIATVALICAAVIAAGFGVRDFRRKLAAPPTPEEARRKWNRAGSAAARGRSTPFGLLGLLLGLVLLPVTAGYLLGAVVPDVFSPRTINERGAWLNHTRRHP